MSYESTSYIGQAIKRFEDAPLVTGRGVFLDDIALPNMLHAAVLRSDHAHARIKSVDVSAARDLSGVVAVLIYADIAGVLDDIPSRPYMPLHPIPIRAHSSAG